MMFADLAAWSVAWLLVVSAVVVGTVAAHLILRRVGRAPDFE